ncbi:hypothetical protein MLD38_033118 [Melastoma candidum]|uniref:Uncharacterized protein n=1 Tax=Melastoma candidum TaxID=119954 RepID=A0ACB9M9F5_9MYRT|nr:hypothetical protein MLD38_033118 [Melastoma candidum]
MEPPRQHRSKICIASRPSSSSPAGNRRKQGQGNLGNLSPESSSCSSYANEEDLLTLDLGRSSSKQTSVPNGTPMKKLLAKEMLQEAKVKRQSPGVVAKLMGLDGIPSYSQHTSSSFQTRQVEDHRLRRKVEKAQRTGNISSRGSSRRSSRDEQEFKDVFEVTECTKPRSCDHFPLRSVEHKVDETEIAFIRRKFLDAKRLSTDDRLQDSKEFDDTLEVLDSNKDLLLKFLQQPDPLFTKHIHELQGTTLDSHWSSNVPLRKASSDRDYETRSPSSKSLRDNGPRKQGKSAKNFPKCSPSGAPKPEGLTGPYTLPTRIVVLKPLMGMGQDTLEANFSPSRQSLPSEFDVPLEFVSLKSSENKLAERKRNSDQTKKPRAIAREIIRKARSTNSSIGSVSMASSRHTVCAEDESSSTVSLDEFAYESDRTSASTNSPNRYKKYGSMPSVESSVCKEAKRRLSERWKLAHRSREKGEASKGSTLAEMLAIPDRIVRYPDLHKVGRQGLNSGSAISVEPLGISSRDGWKGVDLAKLSRSRSLPASSSQRSATSRYPRISRSRHASCDFMETMPRETRWEKHRPTKGNNNMAYSLAAGGSKYPCSERQSPSYRSGYSSDASAEVESIHGQVTVGLKEIDQPTESPVEDMVVAKLSPSTVSEVPFLQQDSSICCIHELPSQEQPCLAPENSPVAAHHSNPQPDSSSSKEVDQPSPVSVLEVPFSDDISSGSECFESLSADLQGLRLQLELLKLESRAYEEGSTIITGDDGAVEEPICSLEVMEFHESAENWEFYYVTDFLIACGYMEDEPADIFITKWHLPECPADPSVFEELEKIYNQVGFSIERKLLFDLINSGIQEIYQPLTDPHPWVRPPSSTIHPSRRKDPLPDILMRLVTCCDRKAGKEALDKALVNDAKWLNVGDDIDLIGKDLAGLLESALVDELLEM